MTHLKLQKLQKGDCPPAHCLSVNVLLNNGTFLYKLQILHLYLQFYYASVAALVLPYSGYVARGTVYVVRIIFEVLP